MSAALQPWTVRGLEMPNRIVVPPMGTWLADPETNEANDQHLVHYGALAMGGSGLLIFEAAPVTYNGRTGPNDLGIYDESHVAGLRRINDYIHKHTQCKTAIQIGHAGRKGTMIGFGTPKPQHLTPNEKFGSECVGPSPIPFKEGIYNPPREMTIEDLDETKKAFVLAAQRVVTAGFDSLELHCAHGMLLSAFLTPSSNQRTDEYGGDLEGRMKYPLEVVTAVRAAIPDQMPLIVRVSAQEWTEGGWTLEDSIVFVQRLKECGTDIVHVSSGGMNSAQNIPRTPQFQIPLAKAIKEAVDIEVIAVGQVEKLADAARIIEEQSADAVGVGRAQLRDPYWLRREMMEMQMQPWFPIYQIGAYASLRKTGKTAEEIRRQGVPKETATS